MHIFPSFLILKIRFEKKISIKIKILNGRKNIKKTIKNLLLKNIIKKLLIQYLFDF